MSFIHFINLLFYFISFHYYILFIFLFFSDLFRPPHLLAAPTDFIICKKFFLFFYSWFKTQGVTTVFDGPSCFLKTKCEERKAMKVLSPSHPTQGVDQRKCWLDTRYCHLTTWECVTFFKIRFVRWAVSQNDHDHQSNTLALLFLLYAACCSLYIARIFHPSLIERC